MHHLATRLDRHFARCAALTLAIGVNAPTVDASVIYSGVVNLNIPSNVNGLYLNVVTGAYNSTGGGGNTVPGWTINPWGNTNLQFFVSTSPVGTQHIMRTGGGGIANLALSDIIGPTPIHGGWSGANLNASITGNQPFFLNSTNNIYGFRFTYNGNTHYGWARIALGNSLIGQPRTLIEYGWQDQPNVPVWSALLPIGVCCFETACGYSTPSECLSSNGTWIGNSSCDFDPCGLKPPPCPCDIAPSGGDGTVNVSDMLSVIGQWGPCPPAVAPPAGCTADIDDNDTVNVSDLLAVIGAWGSCPTSEPRP